MIKIRILIDTVKAGLHDVNDTMKDYDVLNFRNCPRINVGVIVVQEESMEFAKWAELYAKKWYISHTILAEGVLS